MLIADMKCLIINEVVACLHWRNWVLSKAVKEEQQGLLKYNGMHLVTGHTLSGLKGLLCINDRAVYSPAR